MMAVGLSPAAKYEGYFQVFRDIIRSIHSSTSVQEVLEMMVTKSTDVLNARGALLRIHNKKNNKFEVRAACGLGERYLAKGSVTTEKLIPEPDYLHKVLIITDIWNAPRVEYPQQAWDEGIRMMLDVPLAIEDRLIGLIRIYLEEQREFSDDELDFLLTVAEQCACIIERVQLHENQQDHFTHLATRMDKMSSLGRMAAGIAHEINNPLAGILLYSSNMSKKVPQGGQLEEGLQIIIKETQRCKTIIQGLLDFARDKEPQRAPANINAIVEKALSILENEFHLRHIRVERQLDKDMIPAPLDENQIEQVLINLLLNAALAVGDRGTVTIRSRKHPDRNNISVEVVDNGCGIDKDNIKKIFEPFFSTKTNGTGLGLAVSYGIIKNHQGKIQVTSAPGKGTRFLIELPLKAGKPIHATGTGCL
jgi:two-component system NtrC family sensor kinase